jgi:hypothetical protein
MKYIKFFNKFNESHLGFSLPKDSSVRDRYINNEITNIRKLLKSAKSDDDIFDVFNIIEDDLDKKLNDFSKLYYFLTVVIEKANFNVLNQIESKISGILSDGEKEALRKIATYSRLKLGNDPVYDPDTNQRIFAELDPDLDREVTTKLHEFINRI